MKKSGMNEKAKKEVEVLEKKELFEMKILNKANEKHNRKHHQHLKLGRQNTILHLDLTKN